MDLINNLMLGFGVAFTLQNLFYAFFGAILGTLIGVLPGLGPVATIAMLLPSIYALDATPALIMLAGIYYGAQYGGSTTAILINVPGESSSVVTAIDGYQMARRGKAGTALAVAALTNSNKFVFTHKNFTRCCTCKTHCTTNVAVVKSSSESFRVNPWPQCLYEHIP